MRGKKNFKPLKMFDKTMVTANKRTYKTNSLRKPIDTVVTRLNVKKLPIAIIKYYEITFNCNLGEIIKEFYMFPLFY